MWIRSMYIELKPLLDPLQRHLPTLLLTSQYHSLIPIATCWLFCTEFYSSPRKFVRKWILLHGRLQVTSKIGSEGREEVFQQFNGCKVLVQISFVSLIYHQSSFQVSLLPPKNDSGSENGDLDPSDCCSIFNNSR